MNIFVYESRVISLQVVPRKLGVLGLHICDFKDSHKLLFKEISGLSKFISWFIFICLLIMKIGQNQLYVFVDLSVIYLLLYIFESSR